GAAAWYYRVALEQLIGVRLRGGEYELDGGARPPQWEAADKGARKAVEVGLEKRGLLTHGL
ncbi:MAG: hypothetical protein FWH06_04000, partial [Oscillospiraceae bacterium]|nr:hypothetical protein [Oscillospiraceae bacterium]